MAKRYTASKSRTSNRPGWTISFRHPLRTDRQGRPGLKIRRGLGTTDESEAERLVAQMNELLANESWWVATKRQDALEHFDKPIVNAFYDDLVARRADSWATRNQTIELPSKKDGYTKVMLVGTTGAGKTSLLRHLIGSDPERDRFPSTSTAKTTIADIEIVISQGEYEAIVTFFSEHYTVAAIEECILEACKAATQEKKEVDIANALLNHRDQRFRLSYLLGTYQEKTPPTDDEWSFDEETQEPQDSLVPSDEQESNQTAIENYLKRIRSLAAKVKQNIESQLEMEMSSATGEDRDALEDLFEETLADAEGFADLVLDILDAIRNKFGQIKTGELIKRGSGWPESWVFQTPDRKVFLEQVRGFSSNFAPLFGQLLTPLVNGIRIRGPMYPDFKPNLDHKLVLIDGEGLGHTPDSSSSVSTRITRRFDDVDVIVLVDNAQQPMQAAPLAVLRSLAASGHYGKLFIAFTHFDQVKGDNLPTFADKKAHVTAAMMNALTGLKDVVGAPVIRSIEKEIESKTFMLGALDRSKLRRGPVSQLELMLKGFEKQIQIDVTLEPDARPIYYTAGLSFDIQKAATDFQHPWAARLGLGSHDGISKEHWTRVKALNRRIASETDSEYGNLRPVADFIARLQENLSRFLESPTRWAKQPGSEEEAQEVISSVRRYVFTRIHEVALQRLIDHKLPLWRSAYEHRGTGSTTLRARDIQNVYEEAMPVTSADMTDGAKDFLKEIRQIVETAINEADDESRSPETVVKPV